MAFDRSNMNPGARAGKGPKTASYYTTDSLGTVEGAGYFNDMATELATGDFLFVYSTGSSNGGGKIYTVTVSSGTVTLSTGQAIA